MSHKQTKSGSNSRQEYVPSHVGMIIHTFSAATPTEFGPYEGIWAYIDDGLFLQSGSPSQVPVGENEVTLNEINIPKMHIENGTTGEGGEHEHTYQGSNGRNCGGDAWPAAQPINTSTTGGGKHAHAVTGTIGFDTPAGIDVAGRRLSCRIWQRTV